MVLYRVNDKPQRARDDYESWFRPGGLVEVDDIENVDIDGEVETLDGAYILPSALDRVDVVEDFEGVGPQKPHRLTTEKEALAMARANYAYVLWYRQQRERDPQVQAIADATGKVYAEAKYLYEAGLRLVGPVPEPETFQVGDYVTVNPRPRGSTYGIPTSEFPFSGYIEKKGYDVPGDEASVWYKVNGLFVKADMMTKEAN